MYDRHDIRLCRQRVVVKVERETINGDLEKDLRLWLYRRSFQTMGRVKGVFWSSIESVVQS